MLRAAIAYAAKGIGVLPIPAGGKKPHGICTCGVRECSKLRLPPGERPGHRGGVSAATTEERLVRAWWAKWPEANVAVTPPAGIIILDVDAPGRERWDGWATKLPPTPMAQSGSGVGFHTWWRLPPGSPHRGNARGLLGVGIDVRGHMTGYVVAPPSVHASGRLYRWIVRAEVATLPEWLHELLCPPPRTAPPAGDRPGDASRRGRAALAAAYDRVSGAAVGGRHGALVSAARWLGGFAARGLVSAADVRTMLREAADLCGLYREGRGDEVDKAISYGLGQPDVIGDDR